MSSLSLTRNKSRHIFIFLSFIFILPWMAVTVNWLDCTDDRDLYAAVFSVVFVCFVYWNCKRTIQRCSLDVWNFTGLWPGRGAHLLGVCPVSLHLQSLWRVLPHHLHDCNTHTDTHTHTHTHHPEASQSTELTGWQKHTASFALHTLW